MKIKTTEIKEYVAHDKDALALWSSVINDLNQNFTKTSMENINFIGQLLKTILPIKTGAIKIKIDKKEYSRFSGEKHTFEIYAIDEYSNRHFLGQWIYIEQKFSDDVTYFSTPLGIETSKINIKTPFHNRIKTVCFGNGK